MPTIFCPDPMGFHTVKQLCSDGTKRRIKAKHVDLPEGCPAVERYPDILRAADKLGELIHEEIKRLELIIKTAPLADAADAKRLLDIAKQALNTYAALRV